MQLLRRRGACFRGEGDAPGIGLGVCEDAHIRYVQLNSMSEYGG